MDFLLIISFEPAYMSLDWGRACEMGFDGKSTEWELREMRLENTTLHALVC